MHPHATATRGKAAETAALRYLQKKGLRLIERNFRCKLGEIDLIMERRKTLIFVEVRYRNQDQYGDGAASISARKQHKIIHTAALYLLRKRISPPPPCRFDVVSVSGPDPHTKVKITWIKSAFSATADIP